MESQQALNDIKGLLAHLNEDDLNSLICEISYKCNVGIHSWYSPSKIKRMAKEAHGVSITDDDAVSIIQNINDDDYANADEIAFTYIELHIEDS